jgi:DNA/RNA endonuclease YhcR with UshA esterase domain
MIARRSLRLFIVTALVAASPVAHAQQKLTAAEAKDHVGERATVCGAVVSTRYAVRSRGEPTFLNLDKGYPDQIFTIIIWGRDRAKFGAPETKYANKNVCVTGTITSYRGVPEIEATEPSQIKIEN